MPGDNKRPSSKKLSTDTKTLARAFGAVMRRHRDEVGLVQMDVAAATDLERSYISMLENGVYQPSLTTIVKIALFFKLAPSALLAEVEQELARK